MSMRTRLIATVVGLGVMGTSLTANAAVLVKNGQPQNASVTFEQYKEDGWARIPDYHVSNADESIFTRPSHRVNYLDPTDETVETADCLSSSYASALRWCGINVTPEQVFAQGGHNDNTWFEKKQFCPYYDKIVWKDISSGTVSDQENMRKALDYGNIITASVSDMNHEVLIIGYAIKDGTLWWEVIDSYYDDVKQGHCWYPEKDINGMYKLRAHYAICKEHKVYPTTLKYTAANGEEKTCTAYYNSLEYYFPAEIFVDIFTDYTTDKMNKADANLAKNNSQQDYVIKQSVGTNINNKLYFTASDLDVQNGRIITGDFFHKMQGK